MSNSPRQPLSVLGTQSSEADIILRDLRILRDQVLAAWYERCVILTPDEQADLHDEIKRTCELLTDLTRQR